MKVYAEQIMRLLLLGCFLLLFSCQNNKEFVEGLPCKLTERGKWGIVSTDGERMLVPYVLGSKPSCVVNGMFVLPTEEGQLQLYHVDNPYKPVSPRLFCRVGYFFEEVTIAQETPQSPVLLIDKDGNNVFSTEQNQLCQIDLVHNFSEGRALFVTKEGKYGYLNTEGHIIIPPLYDCAYHFEEGVALVGQSDGTRMAYQLIDRDGVIISFIQATKGFLDEGIKGGLLLYKEKDGHCIYLDKTGNPVLYMPEDIQECTPFYHDLAVFRTKNGKAGAVNEEGKIVFSAAYDEAYVAAKNRIVVGWKDKYMLADAYGILVSDVQYDYIGKFYDSDMAVTQKNGAYYWMNRDGKLKDVNWFLISEDVEANREVSQFCYRMPEVIEEKVDKAQKNPNIKNNMVKNVGRPASKRSMSRDAWKKISSQSPFYEEMQKIVSGELEEMDVENRRLILNYIEHFRTSYTTKDIDFLEQLFSEKALIIVGTVIKVLPQSEMNYLPQKQIIYNVKNKRQYLDRLKEVFNSNQEIDVRFDNFKIMRHPTRSDIYGVTLHQHYSSDNYSDDGYLFLLWDFQDRMAPKIHVRTWQPSMQDDNTPLPFNKVFNIRNFNLQ